MSRHPRVTVAFTILRPMSGAVVHEGEFHMDDDLERRAFAERCNDAIADGYEVRTVRADVAKRRAELADTYADTQRKTLDVIGKALGVVA